MKALNWGSMHMNFPYVGETAGICAALAWATATILFSNAGTKLHPLRLNAFKGFLASLLFSITLWVQGQALPDIGWVPISILALSGILGIGMGDSAFFASLNALGPRKTLLLQMTAPPLTVICGTLFLGEVLGPKSWVGVGFAVFGIAWVVLERSENSGTPGGSENLKAGIFFGLISALGQTSGALLSRHVFREYDISSLWTALIRLSFGVLPIWLYLLLRRPKRREKTSDWSLRTWGFVIGAICVGTYGALWCQQTAFKHTEAGIAQTLVATSPIFILPMVALLGEKLSKRAVGGALITLFGIALLFGVI